MAIIIGSARIDESGNLSGGKAGDQKQISTPDYKGEVSMQTFYVHKKGWYILRPIKDAHARKIAEKMAEACNSKYLGYDQGNRLGVIKNGIGAKVYTECDCSALVRACIIEATGKDPGNFTTGDEADVLERSGLFGKRIAYKGGVKILTGDVLVTQSRGHTVICVQGEDRKDEEKTHKSELVGASYHNVSLSGSYKVTASTLNLRLGAGTDHKIIDVMKRGAKVECWGYYSVYKGVKWLVVIYNGITGYCSSEYLKKI